MKFENYKLYDYQEKAKKQILDAFKTKKHIILEGPVGTGKSLIAMALAHHMKSAYIITPRVQLQKQYIKDFDITASSYGKKHYNCHISQRSADVADCSYKKCPLDFFNNKSRSEAENTQDLLEFYSETLNKPEFLNSFSNKSLKFKEFTPEEISRLVLDQSNENFEDLEHQFRLSFIKNLHRASHCDYYKDNKLNIFNSNISILNHGVLANQICKNTGHWSDYKTHGQPTPSEAKKFNIFVRDACNGALIDRRFVKRNVTIIDECHKLEEIGRWLGTLEFTQHQFSSLNLKSENKESLKEICIKNNKNIFEIAGYIKSNYYDLAKSSLAETNRILRTSDINTTNPIMFKTLIQKRTRLVEFIDTIDHFHYLDWDTEHILEYNHLKMSFTCIKPDPFIHHYMFGASDKILMMSGTIGETEDLYKSLNLNKENTEIIRITEIFNYEKSPIIIKESVNLKFANIENINKEIRNLKEEILEIAKDHKDQRGVIHTTSFDTIIRLKEVLKGEKYIFHTESNKLNECLEEFYKTPGSILISPSIKEGLDFKDDLCRFSIITKLPWPSLQSKADRLIYMRDKRKYNNQMLKDLTQMIGRGHRTKTDFCTTYILDKKSIFWLKRSKSHYLGQRILTRIENKTAKSLS